MANKTKRRNRFYQRKINKGGGSGLTLRQPPNFGSNLAMLGSVVAQGLNNITGAAIRKGAQLLVPNVDTNKPLSEVLSETKDELTNVTNVLKSPVGDELVNEASEIGTKIVDAVEKPLEEIGDKGMEYVQKQIPIIEDMAKTTLFGLPVIGSAAAAAEDAFDVVQSLENTIKTGADMFEQGEKMVENLQQPVAEAGQLYSKYKNALDSNIINTNALNTNALNINPMNVNAMKDIATNKINNKVNSLNETMNNKINNSIPNMKKMQQVSRMIGGRTRKSQMDFFSPTIMNGKQQLNGGRRSRITKKRRNIIKYLNKRY